MVTTVYLAQTDHPVQLETHSQVVQDQKDQKDIQEAGEEATLDQKESQEIQDHQVCDKGS